MSFRSKSYYVKVTGDYALWTAPESKGGGEKVSYSVPTRQGLHGIIDNLYWKPVLTNIVEEVKVMNPIRTQTMGFRALLGSGKSDLNYFTYLVDVDYRIKFHYVWNEDREDLAQDRNEKKHNAILERSLRRGGRRDVFLGTRECVAYAEQITEEEYKESKSFYDGQTLSFGLQFHSFEYPKTPGGKLYSYFSYTQMVDGKIVYKPQEECEIRNELSDYTFKYPEEEKSVDEELEEGGEE